MIGGDVDERGDRARSRGETEIFETGHGVGEGNGDDERDDGQRDHQFHQGDAASMARDRPGGLSYLISS